MLPSRTVTNWKTLFTDIGALCEKVFSRIWVRIIVLVVAGLFAVGSISAYVSPTDPSQEITLVALIVTLVVCLLLAAAAVYPWLTGAVANRPKRPVSEAEKLQLADVKSARSDLKRAEKTSKRELSKMETELLLLESPQGRRVASGGGVQVYERWISTPQGSGSIVGVNASAEDSTGISKRLTATRMLTLGVFSLAAPKKKGVGHAYVVIEGPEVNGVAVFEGNKSQGAGPAAFELAAAINNAARAAVANEKSRSSRIRELRKQIGIQKENPVVKQARERLEAALAVLPEDLQARTK